MSLGLVAYGASDDSDASDTDDISNIPMPSDAPDVTSGHISDEDDMGAVSSTSVFPSAAVTTTNSELNNEVLQTTFTLTKNDDAVNSTSLTSLEDLPTPNQLSADVNSEVEEEELEDEVKPKAAEIADAPQPPKKKLKQPVKITIPSLQEMPEDDETTHEKQTAPSLVRSSLFSLLPAPMHSAKKEINRPLIPHSLSKKPVQMKAAASNIASKSSNQTSQSHTSSEAPMSPKRLTTFNALTGYESDSDDEAGYKDSATNFFSLDVTSEVNPTQTSSKAHERLQSEEVSSSEVEMNPAKRGVNDEDVDNNAVTDESPTEPAEEPEPGAVNDAPLDFRSVNRLSSWTGSSYSFLSPVGPSGPIHQQPSFSTYSTSFSVPSNSQYNLVNSEGLQEDTDDMQNPGTDEELQKFINDKEFQKLQGKRKRGFDEAISFVDANVDDYVDPAEASKHLTEESEYVSHKSKDNLPTAQQRRKKQITYLAYQAKERELELKNTWAQNRMTKKQTQSKYGF